MVFNSFHFLFFFIAVVVIHFALPHRVRWIFLLACGYYFYMCWRPEYILLLICTTLLDYSIARGIAASNNPRVRKLLLCTSLCISLGVLSTFKYFTFFSGSVVAAFNAFNIFLNVPAFHLLLPVGISFYTFQSLAYVIDVYRGTTPAEKHFGIFALFVVFFPQLVAGPIERSNHLLPQFYQKHRIEFVRVASGLRLMMWGIFKKMVVADLVAPAVEQVYHDPRRYGGLGLLIATFLFGVQIYCDFSGYSDVAIGAARLMGYDLMINFRQPYFAPSVTDFWRRWHISLSTWFRDYIYYPLGGNRVGRSRWAMNVMIVFLISGLWHGASWTFVAWGAMHGMLLVIEGIFSRRNEAKKEKTSAPAERFLAFRILFTFALITLTWVPFRARSFGDTLYVFTHLFRFGGEGLGVVTRLGLPRFETMMAFIVSAVLAMVEYCLVFQPRWATAVWLRRPVRWSCYLACACAVVFFGVFEGVQFIYFQF